MPRDSLDTLKTDPAVSTATITPRLLSGGERSIVLFAALAGWVIAGIHMGSTTLVAKPAVNSMLQKPTEEVLAQWVSWYNFGILCGAAVGGIIFGWMGDRFGRTKAMAASVLCYSAFAAIAFYARTPEELLLWRFLTGLGIGGLWPNAVTLVSEAWPNSQRPLISGIVGTGATAGIGIISWITMSHAVTPENWRWLLLWSSTPVVLGIFTLLAVPESPRWVAKQQMRRLNLGGVGGEKTNNVSLTTAFRPPLLRYTLIGIVLASVAIVGGWGSNWFVHWAEQVGVANANYGFKSQVLLVRSGTGVIGTLFGAVLASRFGRRKMYFFMCVTSLVTSVYVFKWLTPMSPHFLIWVGVVGFFATMFFGWLPFYMPELFPLTARATGTGASFNIARGLTALAFLSTGTYMSQFAKDQTPYANLGVFMSSIYILGMIAIFFAPDTTKKQLED
ncbi:MAG: MFS transporter [Phycisphaerae bacterium]|nr:MFS transporter [Phycisphaerae bacterium]